jgi:hypothetical protein
MATHPLCSGFSFWFLKRVPNMLDEDYFKNMIKLGTFDTVRERASERARVRAAAAAAGRADGAWLRRSRASGRTTTS